MLSCGYAVYVAWHLCCKAVMSFVLHGVCCKAVMSFMLHGGYVAWRLCYTAFMLHGVYVVCVAWRLCCMAFMSFVLQGGYVVIANLKRAFSGNPFQLQHAFSGLAIKHSLFIIFQYQLKKHTKGLNCLSKLGI